MKPLKKITIALLLAIATLTTAQTNYPSVQIGDQEWMTKNLDVSTFRNGDPIPQAKTNQEWSAANKAKKPAWCYYHIGYSEISKYGGDPEKTKKYGKLYNSAAVNDKRGLAPKGWHIPNNEEWKMLSNNASISSLKSKSGWEENNGSNASGFNALPGGSRDYRGFNGLIENASFWSSSTGIEVVYGGEDLENNFSISLGYWEDRWSYVNYKGESVDIFRLGRSESCGFSVRCIKGEEANVVGINIYLDKIYKCYPKSNGAKIYSEPDTNSSPLRYWGNGVKSPLPEGYRITTNVKYKNKNGDMFLFVTIETNEKHYIDKTSYQMVSGEGYILQSEWYFE
jgi:uncharacterized protein (TIGR02145 family)